jgi:hypothetical protein
MLLHADKQIRLQYSQQIKLIVDNREVHARPMKQYEHIIPKRKSEGNIQHRQVI